MTKPILLSVQIGPPREFGQAGTTNAVQTPWRSAIVKLPIESLIWLGKTNLAGDSQADLKHHGGVDKAVLAYSADHYPEWRSRLRVSDLSYGGFGENFTIAGQTEDSVCIGDIYAVGDVRVQVSQPRTPCWKLSRRWQIDDLSEQVDALARGGWYLRVLVEGAVKAGRPVDLLERPFPQWSVAQAFKVMHHRRDDAVAAAELAACSLLASGWRQKLSARAQQHAGS